MDGVVGADQQLGAGPAELVGRYEEEASRLVPPAPFDVAHVLGQRVRVQRDLGVIVGAEHRGSFRADRAIAQRGPLGAHRDDSHVLGVPHRG
jgi:hypothetical protein